MTSKSHYIAVFLPTAEKEFAKLERLQQTRVLKAVEKLQVNPRPPGCKRLLGTLSWRIRVGEFRVIYSIHDDVLRIEVIKIGHRKSVYRR